MIEPRYALQAINYVQYKIACLTFFSILQHIFKKFFSGKSESDSCTLYYDRTLKDNKSDPHTAYPADQDTLLINLKSRVIAAAISVLGFTDKPRQPTKFPLPVDIAKQSRVQRLEYSRTSLFRTRLIRSPRYFEGRSNALGFTVPLYASLVISKPRYFELFFISLGTSK